MSVQAADEPLRIGLIATYSGPYADYGRQFDAGVALYLKEHGGKIAGRPVEIIKKDTAGPAPDAAKRIAQELVVRDKVSVLTGLDFSPNAYAVAAIATQAKIPTLVMNAASSAITASSPYVARLSFTVQQVTDPMARWMARQGVKEAYTVVADYASGTDAETAFKKAFAAEGGKVVGEVRTPMNNPDFSAYVQRIKDAKPQAVFFFFPSGVMPPAFLKVWKERGMEEAGIKLYATGEATDDSYLDATGDVALGLVTSHHYSYAHASPKNQKFVKDFAAEFGTKLRPSYFAVTAYDTMAAIDLALAKTRGDLAGDKFMEALKGLKFESPRGPIEIDPATRDIVQTVYIRKTERIKGELVNVEFDKFERVKDPAKESQ
jgi:branched-chain amino acid transport system substrate-binding protein